MRVMVMVKATPDSEAGTMPSEQLLREMGAFNEELVKAGIMVMGEGLHPSSKAKRIHFSGTSRTVIDGPFTETKELVAGFWIWNVKSIEEAVEWVKRCPNPMMEDSDIDIRPIFSFEDFGDALTPELRAQEERLWKEANRDATDGVPRVETAPEMYIAGHNASYTLQTRGGIVEQWRKFAPLIGRVPGQTGATSYGVSWNAKNQCDFDYLCGVQVVDGATLPKEYTKLHLPSRKYAVFTHSGHVSEMPHVFDAIWSKWIPNSGHQPAQAPCFERYTEAFNPDTGMGGMEIWIPIQA